MKLNIPSSGFLFLSRDPLTPMEAATKSYVDTVTGMHAISTLLHLTTVERNLLNTLSASSAELNYSVGLTSLIQTQLNDKLSLSGGTLAGTLILNAPPVNVNDAATKSYVDTSVSTSLSKAGGVMTGFITLNAAPIADMHASTKLYVDSSISAHTDLHNLHLTQSQNTFIDALSVSADEVNYLQGVTENVQASLNSKLSKAGGTVTGNIILASGVAVLSSKSPVLDVELVNKAYVDARVKGLEWKSPVSASNLISDVLSTPPGSPVVADVYIVGVSPTGAWAGKAGFATYFNGTTWIYLKSTAVAVGDRFGVRFISSTLVSATLTAGTIVTLVSGVPGNYVWSLEPPTPGASTLIFDEQAWDFGVTYTYTDENIWLVTNKSVNITTGAGLLMTGNTISINPGNGIKVTNDKVYVDYDPTAALTLNGSNQLAINYDFNDFVVTTNFLSLSVANKTILTNTVSKSGNTDVTGIVNFTGTASLTLAKAASLPTDVTNKAYVDTANNSLQTSINTINANLITLNLDPTTQTFVISELDNKFDKNGGTITGDVTIAATKGITVSKAPSATTDVTNKVYVDTSISTHTGDSNIHVTLANKTFLNDITVSAAQINNSVTFTSTVQTELDSKLNLAGGTMTGPLTLSAIPVNALNAATKGYVDTVAALKLDRSGGIVTGQIKNSSNPVAADDLSRKGYSDALDAAARVYTTDLFNLSVLRSGSVMTGGLTLNADPTNLLHASTKQYVDTGISTLNTSVQSSLGVVTTRLTNLETDVVKKLYVDTGLATKINTSGDTLSGYLTLHANPILDMHPATKRYVDTLAQGLKTKPSTRLATTINLNTTYSNGTLGVNATLTSNVNGALNVDGLVAAINDRILVRAQVATLQNGDYSVQQTGNGTTPFILVRSINADERTEIPGSYFFVFDGVTLKGTSWVLSVVNPSTFNLGTDAITVSQFSGPGNIIAGNGISVSGNTVSVRTVSTGRINPTVGGLDLAVVMLTGPGTYRSLTVDTYGRITSATNPTNLLGYGITDAQALNANLTSLAAVTSNAIVVRDTSGAIRTQGLNVAGLGLSINQNGNSAVATNITISSNAVSTATPSTLVARDILGNFSAVQVNAALVGNASTATALLAPVNIQLSGDMTSNVVPFNGSAGVNLEAILAATGVAAGSYSRVTVDIKGRVTSAINPTTLTGYGITDAATLAYVDSKVAELEAKLLDLSAYVMARM